MSKRLFLLLLPALVLAPVPTLAQPDAMAVVRVVMLVDRAVFASFTEFGGVTAEARTLEFFDGHFEGRGVVKLSRPASTDLEISQWHEAAVTGDLAARKSVTILGYNRRGDAVLRYQLENAWPARVEIGSRTAGSAEVLTETVTIVAQRITRIGV